MKRLITIDPERITDRMFGGPHFRAFLSDGETMTCPKTGKQWREADLHTAWMEGRNIPPLVAHG